MKLHLVAIWLARVNGHLKLCNLSLYASFSSGFIFILLFIYIYFDLPLWILTEDPHFKYADEIYLTGSSCLSFSFSVSTADTAMVSWLPAGCRTDLEPWGSISFVTARLSITGHTAFTPTPRCPSLCSRGYIRKFIISVQSQCNKTVNTFRDISLKLIFKKATLGITAWNKEIKSKMIYKEASWNDGKILSLPQVVKSLSLSLFLKHKCQLVTNVIHGLYSYKLLSS